MIPPRNLLLALAAFASASTKQQNMAAPPTAFARGEVHLDVDRAGSNADLAMSDSAGDEEDVTAWRAGAEEEDDAAAGELDSRVTGAFDQLNIAIAHNNAVEAA